MREIAFINTYHTRVIFISIQEQDGCDKER
jgi:hypothetical protein